MSSLLLNAFALAPEKAIEFLQGKGYAFSWDWTDTWQEAHAQAFTVAKVMRMDILQDIRALLDDALVGREVALDDGTKVKRAISFQQFKKELTPTLKAKGWWGKVAVGDAAGGAEMVQLGSPWRLKTIFQTNMQTSLMAGRYAGMMETVEDRPYWEFVAVMDSRTRPEHAALHGLVFPHDDPFWDTHFPPLAFNCRCRVRNRSGRELRRDGRAVSSSDGRLHTEERLVSKRTGLMAEVTGYETADGTVVFTDPGFNYNPGREKWTPDKGKYDRDIWKQYLRASREEE